MKPWALYTQQQDPESAKIISGPSKGTCFLPLLVFQKSSTSKEPVAHCIFFSATLPSRFVYIFRRKTSKMNEKFS